MPTPARMSSPPQIGKSRDDQPPRLRCASKKSFSDSVYSTRMTRFSLRKEAGLYALSNYSFTSIERSFDVALYNALLLILISAGEASGEMYGAQLIDALRRAASQKQAELPSAGQPGAAVPTRAVRRPPFRKEREMVGQPRQAKAADRNVRPTRAKANPRNDTGVGVVANAPPNFGAASQRNTVVELSLDWTAGGGCPHTRG